MVRGFKISRVREFGPKLLEKKFNYQFTKTILKLQNLITQRKDLNQYKYLEIGKTQ